MNLKLKLVLILFFGLVLRLISLDQSFWLDEATSVVVARDFSYSEILTKFSPGDFHPPLYYILLKLWIYIFGSSEIAVRMLSVVFGIATIWLVYKIALILSKENNWKFPEVAAILLATSGLHIYYSQEARMYAMETFLATIVGYFVLKRQFVWLTFTSATLLYTDYLPVFLLISFFVYIMVYHKKYLPHLFGWIGGTAVIFVPWVPIFLSQMQTGLLAKQNAPLWWVTLGKTNIKEVLLVPVKFIIGRISSYDKIFYGVSVGVAAIPFAVSIFHSFLQFSKIRFLWFWFIGPIILSAVFGIFLSGFSYFRLIFVLPAFYLLVAYGVLSIKNNQIKKWVIGGVILVNLVTSGIYLFNPRFHREDWRSAVAFIEDHSQKDAGVIFVSKNQRDAYHYYAKTVPSFGPEGADLEFQKLWFMRYVQPIFDPKDELRAKIENIGYRKVDEKDFNGIVVWEYVR